MKYKKLGRDTSVKPRVKSVETQAKADAQKRQHEIATKKEALLVVNRSIGAHQGVIVTAYAPKALRNGVPIMYPVKKYFVPDPGHASFARELTHTFHVKHRSNWTAKERKDHGRKLPKIGGRDV